MVKGQEPESGASGARGRPGDTKAADDSKDQIGIIHAHK